MVDGTESQSRPGASGLSSHSTDGPGGLVTERALAQAMPWRGKAAEKAPRRSKLLEASFQARHAVCDFRRTADLLRTLVSSVSTLAKMVPIPDLGSPQESFARAARPTEGLQGVKLLPLTLRQHADKPPPSDKHL